MIIAFVSLWGNARQKDLLDPLVRMICSKYLQQLRLGKRNISGEFQWFENFIFSYFGFNPKQSKKSETSGLMVRTSRKVARLFALLIRSNFTELGTPTFPLPTITATRLCNWLRPISFTVLLSTNPLHWMMSHNWSETKTRKINFINLLRSVADLYFCDKWQTYN